VRDDDPVAEAQRYAKSSMRYATFAIIFAVIAIVASVVSYVKADEPVRPKPPVLEIQ